MVQGHGSPAQCWKPVPSCRAVGAVGEPFIRAWGARIDVSPGRVLDSVEDVEVDSALPRRGCTWCAAAAAAAAAGCPPAPACATVPQWKAELCPP